MPVDERTRDFIRRIIKGRKDGESKKPMKKKKGHWIMLPTDPPQYKWVPSSKADEYKRSLPRKKQSKEDKTKV